MIVITDVKVEYMPDTHGSSVITTLDSLPEIWDIDADALSAKKVEYEYFKPRVYKSFLDQKVLLRQSKAIAEALQVPEHQVTTEIQDGIIRREILVYMTEKVQNALDLPFEELDNLKNLNQQIRERNRKISMNLEKAVAKQSKYENASLWERLRYVFTRSV